MPSGDGLVTREMAVSEIRGDNVLSDHVRAVLNAVRENRGPGRKAGWKRGIPSSDR